MRSLQLVWSASVFVGVAFGAAACASGESEVSGESGIAGPSSEDGGAGHAGTGGAGGHAGSGGSAGSGGKAGSGGSGGAGGSAGKGGAGGSGGSAGSGGSGGKGGSAGSGGAGGFGAGGSGGAGGFGAGGSGGAGGCADPGTTCQALGTVGSYCAGPGMAPPSTAVDCTTNPKACPTGYDCLTNGGMGYCLEPCGSGGAGGTGGSGGGGGAGGSGGTGTSDCSKVTNPSGTCCVDATHLLDCTLGLSGPIDCTILGSVCGWDSVLGAYDCVTAPGSASTDPSEPFTCGGGAGGTGGTGGAGGAGGTGGYDGTVGTACVADTDCQKVAASTAVCTADAFTGGPKLPTPVCMLTTCDAGTDGKVHYCDGPDAPTSPGICVTSGTGTACRGKCTFADDGKAATGCLGDDHCYAYGAGADAQGVVQGVGICSVGCTADKQCPTGSVCDPLFLACVTTPLAATLQIGDACTSSSACNCTSGSATTQGYCVKRCIVGNGTNDGCDAGYVCDAFLQRTLSNGKTAFTQQNAGMLGECRKSCTVGGAACPGATTCKSDTVAGPDCL